MGLGGTVLEELWRKSRELQGIWGAHHKVMYVSGGESIPTVCVDIDVLLFCQPQGLGECD